MSKAGFFSFVIDNEDVEYIKTVEEVERVGRQTVDE